MALLQWDVLVVSRLIGLSLKRVDRLIRLTLVAVIVILFGFIFLIAIGSTIWSN